MKKWFEEFNDERFSNYFYSGEAKSVLIVRDYVREINTKGKWIDIVYNETCGFNEKMIIAE